MTNRYSPGSGLPPISDDLLSAYLDGQVTPAERQRAEKALAEDPAVRGRYMMLRQTVLLLRQTPRVAVPRSFVLSEAQVLAAGGRVAGVARPGFFAHLLAGMSRALPVATAAVAVALFLVVGVDVWRTQFGAPDASAPAALSVSQPDSQPLVAAPTSPTQEKAAVQAALQQPESTQAPAAASAAEIQPGVDEALAEYVTGESLTAPTAAAAEATAAFAAGEAPADVGQAAVADSAAAMMFAEATPLAAGEGALNPAPEVVLEAAPEAAAAAKMAGEEPPGIAAAAALAPEPTLEMTSAAPARMGPAVLTETVAVSATITVSPTITADTFTLETETLRSASKQEPVATPGAEAMTALQAAAPESASVQSQFELATANALTETAQPDVEPTPLPTATATETIQAVEPTVVPTQAPAIQEQEPATPTPVPTPEPSAVIAQPEQAATEPPPAKVVAQPTAVVVAAAGDQNVQAAGQAPAVPDTVASPTAARVGLRTVEAGLAALLVVLVGATLLVYRRRAQS